MGQLPDLQTAGVVPRLHGRFQGSVCSGLGDRKTGCWPDLTESFALLAASGVNMISKQDAYGADIRQRRPNGTAQVICLWFL